MKVKTFEFTVCNGATYPHNMIKAVEEEWYQRLKGELITPEMIDAELNSFTRNIKVHSVSVSTVDVKYHNNGGSNTIKLYYTITYSN